MTDRIDDILVPYRPTADRPLLGQTVLLAEDSRYAGETMRLICLRSGARIRRADSLRAAARHLTNYRPSVVVIDAGLPDGSGLDLLSQLAAASPRIPVLLAISGDPDLRDAALATGADGFLAKPIASVAAFQSAILAHLPAGAHPAGPRALSQEDVHPDDAALADDLTLLGNLLDGPGDDATRDYAVRFALGLARSIGDTALERAAMAALDDPALTGRLKHAVLSRLPVRAMAV
ncbi:response regulator receiver domain protein [Oceaniovalibus guishaninsula JLT2003]|uniref:Response regulator receiver domain protein n=1 Tax=Oceaniovalibus guishaninsula JLT2003 TaxID=1231392 RepID=K2HNP6_9RHOB|nr:response regulator [Oceaniovalibus guishaninsula]EKE44484.1 response regulator receiver domain protein [Oceaniovalibus guishaninsula JLT2003]